MYSFTSWSSVQRFRPRFRKSISLNIPELNSIGPIYRSSWNQCLIWNQSRWLYWWLPTSLRPWPKMLLGVQFKVKGRNKVKDNLKNPIVKETIKRIARVTVAIFRRFNASFVVDLTSCIIATLPQEGLAKLAPRRITRSRTHNTRIHLKVKPFVTMVGSSTRSRIPTRGI